MVLLQHIMCLRERISLSTSAWSSAMSVCTRSSSRTAVLLPHVEGDATYSSRNAIRPPGCIVRLSSSSIEAYSCSSLDSITHALAAVRASSSPASATAHTSSSLHSRCLVHTPDMYSRACRSSSSFTGAAAASRGSRCPRGPLTCARRRTYVPVTRKSELSRYSPSSCSSPACPRSAEASAVTSTPAQCTSSRR